MRSKTEDLRRGTREISAPDVDLVMETHPTRHLQDGMISTRVAISGGFLLASFFFAPAVSAAGSCGSGGEQGERVPITYAGSVYYVSTPEDYTPEEPWPLIVGLHGDEGDPANSVNWFWRDVPDGTFIFVAPKAPNESGSWYEEQGSNEQWMDALFDTLRALYNVDLDRTYIWGLSGGAVFSSRYVAERQSWLAAAQFNMGGSGTRDYVSPPSPDCKIKTRFAVSPTDFLVESAQRYYSLLTENGHETEWVDADCEGHCWDESIMQESARDWLLARTLCDRTPTSQCDGDPSPPTDPGNGGTGGANLGGDDSGAGGAVSGAGGGSSGPDLNGVPEPGEGADEGDSTAGDDDGLFKGLVAEEASGCSMAPTGAKAKWGWLLLLVFGATRTARRRSPQ
jgi:MYXO-CTERM domain-containing protein